MSCLQSTLTAVLAFLTKFQMKNGHMQTSVNYDLDHAHQISILEQFELSPLELPKGFCLLTFFSRYMAGNTVLRENRQVSRKKLALAASGLPSQDDETTQVLNQIQHFKQAVATSKEHNGTVTVDLLCAINNLVAPDNKYGNKVRDHEVVVKSINKGVIYTPPPPHLLESLLNQFTLFISDSNLKSLYRAYAGHAYFALIHPFLDGNGRCARILWHALTETDSSIVVIPPFLHRLAKPNSAYVSALHSFGANSYSGLEHPFWLESLKWGERVKSKYGATFREAINKLRKCARGEISDTELDECLSAWWVNPIINLSSVLDSSNANSIRDIEIIQLLIEKEILYVRPVRIPAGEVVLECPVIMDCFIQMEDILFNTL